jgi:type II secretory pathway pseudopilin PulG
MNRTRTWPFWVRASAGSIRPSVVVKLTTVPLCTGVPAPGELVVVVPGVVGVVGEPGVVGVVGVVGVLVVPFSITVATISMDPLTGTTVAVGKSVMTEPDGASSGTLSQAAANERAPSAVRTARTEPGRVKPRNSECSTIRGAKDNTLMYLEGQGGQRGYAMAAVLVALAVMSVLMTALLPVWRQQAQREKEAELLFRGAQYARAIALFRAKNGNVAPPNIDILVQQKYLRKKYKDPMTGEDFQPMYVGQQPTQPGMPGTGRQGAPAGGFGQPPQQQTSGGGLLGVQSKSKETAIRNHRGATTYNQWQFQVTDDLSGPGFTAPGRGNQPGAGQPGQQGPGRGGQPGRGNTPGTGAPPPRGGGPGGRGPGRGSLD